MSDEVPPALPDAVFHECGDPVPGYGGLRYSQFLRPGEACMDCGFDPGFPIPDIAACHRRLVFVLGEDAPLWVDLLARSFEESR